MSGVSKKLMGTTAAGGGFTAIEDVFSTYLYTGNGSTQTITNGIDLAGEGGLVWIKSRSNADPHLVFDTDRGVNKFLNTNTTAAEQNKTGTLTSFNANGFSLGSTNEGQNFSGLNYASWTFRKAPRFFDVVTYTGTGSARTIAHNLGTTVGSIIIKRTDGDSNWAVYHRGNTAAPETNYLRLNLTNATVDNDTYWNDTAPTDSVFTVGTNAAVNASGGTYVAYLYAHDPLGPSGDGSDGLIACGSYTGNGSDTAGPVVDLGWEPQFVIVKRATGGTSDWLILDTMRGMSHTSANLLRPNTSGAELAIADGWFRPSPTGFQVMAPGQNDANASGSNYIYIAIRRGPMRAPESGTEVFAPISVNTSAGTAQTTNFPVDLQLFRAQSFASGTIAIDRLRGVSTTSTETSTPYLLTNTTDAETASTGISRNWGNTGFEVSGASAGLLSVFWNFRRAPNFFDVVAYTGDGVAGRTVPHNLGVAPEMMIVKNRGDVRDWIVYHKDLGATYLAELNTTAAAYQNSSYWPSVPTDTVFSPGNASATNRDGFGHIAYLFATLAGVSKVGSYTGNGTSQTIDCGFTTGARFILIKRTDSTGDWYVWDTARGIVTGNDPFLELNTTDAEVTSDDSIDPDSSGFIVNQTATTNINVSAASYIFYAVA